MSLSSPSHSYPWSHSPSPTHTFQREDTVPQGVHNVIQCCLVRHVEEVFVVGVAGDVLDLVNEGPRVLLPADVMAQDLGTRAGRRRKVGGRRQTEKELIKHGWEWLSE